MQGVREEVYTQILLGELQSCIIAYHRSYSQRIYDIQDSYQDETHRKQQFCNSDLAIYMQIDNIKYQRDLTHLSNPICEIHLQIVLAIEW